MTATEQIVERYLESFNVTDPARRRAMLVELYGETGGYIDPNQDLTGAAEIDQFLAATQEQFPGYVFSLASRVDAHHSQARFHWQATAPGDSEPQYIGFDVIVVEDGQIAQVHGFIDKAPTGDNSLTLTRASAE